MATLLNGLVVSARLATELGSTALQDRRSVALIERGAAEDDHESLEDGGRPEHPAPTGSACHEAAYNGADSDGDKGKGQVDT